MDNESITVLVGIVGNILSVVGVVLCNKYITEVDGFHFMLFLSFLHFSFTAVGCKIMMVMGIFKHKEAQMSGVMPVALGSLMSVGK